MRITLVYTGISQIGFFSAGKDLFEQDTRQKALGLCYLGAGLKRVGHTVNLLDLRFLTGYWGFAQRLAEFNPEVVGISILTPNRDYAFECARIAKGMGKIVVGGGVYATSGHDDMMESGYFDYVVTGEADISFIELVEQLGEGHAPEGKVIQGKHVEELDAVPFPDVDLYDQGFYRNLPGWKGFRSPAEGMIASRGCPAQCTFCKPLAEKMFGRKMRFRSAENMLAEVQWHVTQHGVKTIHTYDDTFPANKKLLFEFCEKVAKSNFDLEWTINARADSFTEDVAQALSQSGCRMVSFGFESCSQWILDYLKKGTTVEQNHKAAALCKAYGMRLLANILVGVPGETDRDYENNYRFVKETRPDLVFYNTLMPTPGTAIHDELKAKGMLREVTKFEDYAVSPWHGLISGVDYERVRKWERIIKYDGKFGYYFHPYREKFITLLERGFTAAGRLAGW